MSYKLSVIVLVDANFVSVKNCFQALKNQSIGFENIEVIFIVNKSKDLEFNLINQYNQEYKNVNFINFDSKSSMGNILNKCINSLTSEYIMFIDSNNLYYNNSCKVLCDKMNQTNADIVMGYYSKKIFDSEEKKITPNVLENNTHNNSFKQNTENINDIQLNSVKDNSEIIENLELSNKIFNVSFIKNNNIVFLEDIPSFPYFVLNTYIHASKIIIIDENIYLDTNFVKSNDLSIFQNDLSSNFEQIQSHRYMLNLCKKHDFLQEYLMHVLQLNLVKSIKSLEYHNISLDNLLKSVNESYDLFYELKQNNFTVSKEYNDIFLAIINKDYDKITNIYRRIEENDYDDNQNTIPYIKEINVAVIMDPFTYNSFSNEFNDIIIRPDNWYKQFTDNDIDLLFVESAWHGLGEDSIINGVAVEKKSKPWEGMIWKNLDREEENRTVLFEVLDYCKKNGIPTIYWNKEDPTSFYKRDFNFANTALRFDYIFTTDEDIIPKYKAMGHDKVYPLLFASQIKLYNPIERSNRSDDIVFAGSWYAQFPERCAVMKNMFDKIINSEHTLKIYNREYGSGAPTRQFPDKYTPYIHPGVPQTKMPGVYKESKFSLNINTVTGSHTMFARRVYELMSSNTFVISNYSIGIYDLFKDNVLYLDKMDKLEINKDDVDRICEENLYNVLENHTYSKRFKYILNTIGFKYKEKRNIVHIIYLLKNENQLNKISDDFNSFKYHDKKCYIIYDDVFNIENENKFKDENYNFLNYRQIENLYNISSNNESYFIFRDIEEEVGHDFIKKALLHFQYLDKHTGIKKGSKKYTLDVSYNFINILFNEVKLENVLSSLIYEHKDNQFDIYII